LQCLNFTYADGGNVPVVVMFKKGAGNIPNAIKQPLFPQSMLKLLALSVSTITMQIAAMCRLWQCSRRAKASSSTQIKQSVLAAKPAHSACNVCVRQRNAECGNGSEVTILKKGHGTADGTNKHHVIFAA
jgi:hypothetical protein